MPAVALETFLFFLTSREESFQNTIQRLYDAKYLLKKNTFLGVPLDFLKITLVSVPPLTIGAM